MQFKVPQFLEIEDKIFGPFTFKEFVYLAGGGGACFVLYKWLGLLIGIIPMLLVAAFSLALTFYRPNGKPFIEMVAAGMKYMSQDKLYVWKKRQIKKSSGDKATALAEQRIELLHQGGQRLGASRLRDLAWSLDVLDLKKENKDASL